MVVLPAVDTGGTGVCNDCIVSVWDGATGVLPKLNDAEISPPPEMMITEPEGYTVTVGATWVGNWLTDPVYGVNEGTARVASPTATVSVDRGNPSESQLTRKSE